MIIFKRQDPLDDHLQQQQATTTITTHQQVTGVTGVTGETGPKNRQSTNYATFVLGVSKKCNHLHPPKYNKSEQKF